MHVYSLHAFSATPTLSSCQRPGHANNLHDQVVVPAFTECLICRLPHHTVALNVLLSFWDQGAGNSGKVPQKSKLKLELEFTRTGGICQEEKG